MNITSKNDEEIMALANPMWRDLIKSSNDGDYSRFVKNFSPSLMVGLDEIEVGRQFATSELTRNLTEEFDELGLIRRGDHVTVLYRQRSTKREGEWLGRLVLGYDGDDVKIFGASIF